MNTVRVYSRAKDGDRQLSPNFKVREFACKDGTDTIFISDRLVWVLQAIRSHFGASVNINSAYRTHTHNANVDGDPRSNHLYGMAADITVAGVAPTDVALFADGLLGDSGGVGLYKTFVHIGVQEQKTRWKEA